MQNKKRLIDAMQAVTKMSGRIMPMIRMGENPTQIYNEVLQVITEAPTVDAAEVVHGQWVNPYINRYGHPCHCCSVCGFKASYQDKNYCPNCGSEMDGGVKA